MSAGLHLDALDVQMSIAGLALGRFGTRAWMEQMSEEAKAAQLSRCGLQVLESRENEMSPQTRRKLEGMFNLYSSNASLYSDLIDTFVCPICFRGFGREAIDKGLLSIEHVVPSALGGRVETLTCKLCNNTQGSSLDAQLVRLMRAEDMAAGLEKIPGKLFIGQAEVSVNVLLSPQDKGNPQWLVEGTGEKRSKPGHLQLSADEFMAGKDGRFDLNFGFKDVPSRVALIRSAYLMMFRYFGYAYIRLDAAEPVKAQIAQPNTATEVLSGITKMDERPIESNVLAILKQPKTLQCFTVFFCFKTKAEHFWAVSLPGFNDDAVELYERFRASARQTCDYTIIPFDPEFVANPKLKHMPERVWYQVTRT